MGYYLSKKAEQDVVDIFVRGVATFGIYQAEKYHELLASALQILSDNPFVAFERTELSPPVRIHPFKSHVIIYLIDSNGDIFIVRVRHGHEDWRNTNRPE
ncbi:MAG TPA: type II toxin-antitoxin system RelE/ParE family toxin [Cellvibrionaceae bacterium]